MGLRKLLRPATSADLFDGIGRQQQTLQNLARNLVDFVDNVEVPNRNGTISALSEAIKNEQAEVANAAERSRIARTLFQD